MPTLHALLLTDVVDSTRLTEELGDAAMAALWTAHDRVARDLLPAWRGREIDKTDGMLLLFDDVTDAVGYALAYHRALAARELPFKARAGIHVGPISLRPNTPDDVARGAKQVEVDGLALPIAARVMSVALGAQTLLSADARLALGIAPQRVVSHGHWRMHGVADPVELFEIGEVGEGSIAPFKAPPDSAKVYRVMRQGELWQPVREVRHSVPAERDSFVGRQEPLQVLAKKFDDGARLVSVLGMGGTGKTRLVTRFAWTVLGDYPGGVWFCELSQARTVDGIHFAVAQGLDVPLGKADPVVQLAHAIAGRGRCLVILDNFEQVARHAEETLGRWLDRAPLAEFIVTTREVLGIVGEEMLALAPLATDEAVALFQRRADAVRGRAPAAGIDELAAVTQLVKMLDGLPLAIELAAARVHVMPPRALLARMHERFNVLLSRGGRRDRQATLRAAFDWSWELLSNTEKFVLAQLSVFEGGFTIEAAEASLDLGDDAMPGLVADVIASLLDKSFVRPGANGRFDLLESMREYAGEHLHTAGRFAGSGPGAAEAAYARHWHYFSGLDEHAAISDRGADTNNLVAACRRAANAGDAPAAIDALINAWAALRLMGPAKVALDLTNTMRRSNALSADQRAVTAWVAGSALEQTGEASRAREEFASGLADLAGRESSRTHIRLLLAMGSCQMTDGQLDAACATLSSARLLALAAEDRSAEALALNKLGKMMDHQGRIDEARAHYEAALRIAQQISDRDLEGALLGNLGGLLYDVGELVAARAHYERALTLTRNVGDRRWEGNARCNLGLVHLDEGHIASAEAEFETALKIALETGHARLAYTVKCNLGLCFMDQARFEEADRQLDAAIAGASNAEDRRSEGQFRGYRALLCSRRGRTEAARELIATAEGLLRGISDRLSTALLQCHRAEVEHRAGNPFTAHTALENARSIAREIEALPTSELCRRLAVAAALVE